MTTYTFRKHTLAGAGRILKSAIDTGTDRKYEPVVNMLFDLANERPVKIRVRK